MAVRFDTGTSDGLARTASILNYNAAYTNAAWVYVVTNPGVGVDRTFWALDTNAAVNYDRFGIVEQSGVFNLFSTVVPGSGGEANFWGAYPGVATWFHVALVRLSNTQMACYVNGAQLGTTWTHTTVSGRATAATRFDVGNIGSPGATAADARMYAFKQWSAALTQAEIAAEMWSVRPARLTNLEGCWPLMAGATVRLLDYSGKGRNFTALGSLTDEAPPDLGWGATPLVANDQGTAPPPSAVKARRTLHAFGTRAGQRLVA